MVDLVPEGDNNGVQGPDGGWKQWNNFRFPKTTNMQGRVLKFLFLKNVHIFYKNLVINHRPFQSFNGVSDQPV